MQQRFNELIKQDVKPFLSGHGFAKKGLNFTKVANKLVYLFNFQKSAGNSADQVMFYVNCGIYAAELAELQGKAVPADPREVDCHFRARIEQIAEAMPDRFSITPDTDRNDLRETLLGGLEAVLRFYETMTSARSIVNYYTAGPYLHLGEESFHLLLRANDREAAATYLQALREKHGTEARWAIFEKKYRVIFQQYGAAWDT